jgi:hypothetical protein
MPDANLMPAFLKAFQVNELGPASPYQLIFAAKGSAGASFGAMQGDLAAGQKVVTKTFHDCLAAAGVSEDKIATLTAKLSVHLLGNPLNANAPSWSTTRSSAARTWSTPWISRSSKAS